MFRFIQRWRDRRAVKAWIRSAGVDPVKLITAEDERALVQIIALLASKPAPIVAEETSSDPPPAGSEDEEGVDRSGYWVKDWQDIVAEEVCQKRFGEL